MTHTPGPHRHCDTIALPDGTLIRASSFLSQFEENERPAFGVYLDPAWNPSWPHMHIDWPDFGIPANRPSALASVADVLSRAQRGELVEIGCLGGHGRTGTFLALLAIAAGEPPTSAVTWVRSNYCPRAVETVEQAEYVESF